MINRQKRCSNLGAPLAMLGKCDQKLENPVETHISHKNHTVVWCGSYVKRKQFNCVYFPQQKEFKRKTMLKSQGHYRPYMLPSEAINCI